MHGLLIILLAACGKKDAVVPAKNENSSALPAKPDSVVQMPVTGTFTPYIDTFYGMVFESDFVQPTNADSVIRIHVYAHYLSGSEVRFSSDYYNSWVMSAQMQFYGDFIINDSNCYSTVFEKNIDYYNFRLHKDSLYYNSSGEECPDVDKIYFTGKRTSVNAIAIR